MTTVTNRLTNDKINNETRIYEINQKTVDEIKTNYIQKIIIGHCNDADVSEEKD